MKRFSRPVTTAAFALLGSVSANAQVAPTKLAPAPAAIGTQATMPAPVSVATPATVAVPAAATPVPEAAVTNILRQGTHHA
jgi:hypothetical protein